MLAEALKAEADAFVAGFADDLLPDVRWRRCFVHFYRNVLSHVPSTIRAALALARRPLEIKHTKEHEKGPLQRARAMSTPGTTRTFV